MLVLMLLWVGVGYPLMLASDLMIDTAAAATIADSATSLPTTCTSVAAGTVPWNNPANAASSTTSVAITGTLDNKNTTTHDLRCTGFNFSTIPANATIAGITLLVTRSATNAAVSEAPVSLLKAGTKVGTGAGGAAQPAVTTSMAQASFGGTTNLWSTSWTISDITNANFGATYAINNTGGNPSRTVSVQTVSIKIDYNYPATTYTQSGYRLYDSSPTAIPGAPKAATNQKAYVAIRNVEEFTDKLMYVVATGSSHTCALATDGTAYCWGDNYTGQLGDGTTSSRYAPTSVSTTLKFSSITAGDSYTCALATDGTAYCWGSNYTGQLGDNTTSSRNTPTSVSTTLKFSSITAGYSHTCALTTDGTTYCWGGNGSGQLGDGTEEQKLIPGGAESSPEIDIIPNSFRLRMAISVNNAPIDINSKSFRLEYAVRVSASCSLQTTGFSVVTHHTPIAWHLSSQPVHGDAVVANALNDPVTQNVTYQSIVKDSSSFTNSTAVASGQYMLWDFALQVTDEVPGNSYCLRVANSDGTALSGGYEQIPEITTFQPTEPPSVSFVSSAGQSVAAPSFQMPGLNMLPDCQVGSVGLGSASGARLRISQWANPTDGFAVTIAPRDGQSALWTDAVSSNYYDFNDGAGSPGGCSNGSDGDMYAGQLTIDRSSSVLSPSVGCDLTGLSYVFGPAAFESGSTDIITLVSGSSSVSTNCRWDLTDTIISQTIPPNQPAGDYSLDLTITVVAS